VPALARQAVFVGREQELARLRAHLVAVRGGSGGVALIAGEPGIGKTRLLTEMAAQARDAEALVLLGHAYESAGLPPYFPFVEALRAYVRACDPDRLQTQLGSTGAELALLLPELHDRLPDLPRGRADSPELDRFGLFEAVVDVLVAVARSAAGGLLLVLEDLHWADTASLELVQHLVRRLAEAPLLLVISYRTVDVPSPHPLPGVLAELSRVPAVERLTLQPLPAEETATLIAGLLVAPAAPEAAARVHDQTEGNPFFIIELLRQLQGAGIDLTAAAAVSARWPVPEGVRQVISKRLARLDQPTSQLLQGAAVLGERFSFELLVTMTGGDEAALLPAFEAALGAGLVQESADGYAFTHALIRQTVLAALSAPRRQRLHLRAAEALVPLHAATVDAHLAAIAGHYRQAGPAADPGLALAYTSRAAAAAAAVLAWEDAAALYQVALDLLTRQGTSVEPRYELLLLLGNAQRRAGGAAEALTTLQQALAVARTLGGPVRLATVALRLDDAVWSSAELDASLVALLAEAVAGLPDTEDALRAQLTSRIAYWTGLQPRPDAWREAGQLSRAAIDLARRAGDPVALARVLHASLETYGALPQGRERLAVATELLRIGQTLGDGDWSWRGYTNRSAGLLQVGDLAALDDNVEAHRRLAVELREPWRAPFTPLLLAMRSLLVGQFEQAESYRQQALAAGQLLQSTVMAGHARHQRYFSHWIQGRLAEIEPEVVAEVERYPTLAYPCFRLAILYWQAGRQADARREYERLARHEFADLTLQCLAPDEMTLAAELCAALEDSRRAALLYERFLPFAGISFTWGPAVFLGPAAYYLGLLATTVGRVEAATHFEAALALSRRLNARPFEAHTQRAYATLLQRRGQRQDLVLARERLAAALSIYDELGMARWAATTRAWLATPQLAAAARVPQHPAGLSAREVEVLRLVAAGKSNPEIAATLVLSRYTVERHVNHILTKTGTANRTEAARYAHQHGLLDA
jgi:DNA-binding CsgD family transcriptional regulator